jgi:uncharacterized protein YceK
MKRIFMAVVLVLMMVTMGCASYYQITDPGSDKVYYTTKVDKNRDGSIEFKDATSGGKITLQSSEVLKIKKDEFKSKTAK